MNKEVFAYLNGAWLAVSNLVIGFACTGELPLHFFNGVYLLLLVTQRVPLWFRVVVYLLLLALHQLLMPLTKFLLFRFVALFDF